ncbi:hypothetical protein QP027_01725 [Corynebacterium breve]|uniref:Uncharacterized protein n=1 Tax=Corynebacterium breve TaxID=3049799 RepID=A0ABY8VF70_9CORY|nr:hypothetical protein [Corynebacterium breve]WIM68144.1 hypothetical protein QP027_01725 [Corynebacterium breve]
MNNLQLLDAIASEASSNPNIDSGSLAGIQDYASGIRSDLAKREGLDTSQLRSAASALGGRGGGVLDTIGNVITIVEFGKQLIDDLSPLFEGIGEGAPAEQERRIDNEHREFTKCLDDFSARAEECGDSIDIIADDGDQGINLLLALILRLMKFARFSPPGVIIGIIIDLIMNGLGQAKGIAADQNESIETCLDRVIEETEALCDKEMPEPSIYVEPEGIVDKQADAAEIPTDAASATGELTLKLEINLNCAVPSEFVEELSTMMTGPLATQDCAPLLGAAAAINESVQPTEVEEPPMPAEKLATAPAAAPIEEPPVVEEVQPSRVRKVEKW